MKRLASPTTIVLALLVIVVTNVIILGKGIRNRSGQPLAKVTLTERELRLPDYLDQDQTAVFLSLSLGDQYPREVVQAAWVRGEPRSVLEHPWLTREKLMELGFRAEKPADDADADDYYAGVMGRQAYIVCENDGEAFQRYIKGEGEKVDALAQEVATHHAMAKQLEDAKSLLAIDQEMRSRLWPVDAGVNAPRLRERYPDRQRYLIMPGIINLRLVHPKDGQAVLRTSMFLLVSDLHVATGQRGQIEKYLTRTTPEEAMRQLRANPIWPKPMPPRYRVIVAVGHNQELWIDRIEPM